MITFTIRHRGQDWIAGAIHPGGNRATGSEVGKYTIQLHALHDPLALTKTATFDFHTRVLDDNEVMKLVMAGLNRLFPMENGT